MNNRIANRRRSLARLRWPGTQSHRADAANGVSDHLAIRRTIVQARRSLISNTLPDERQPLALAGRYHFLTKLLRAAFRGSDSFQHLLDLRFSSSRRRSRLASEMFKPRRTYLPVVQASFRYPVLACQFRQPRAPPRARAESQ